MERRQPTAARLCQPCRRASHLLIHGRHRRTPCHRRHWPQSVRITQLHSLKRAGPLFLHHLRRMHHLRLYRCRRIHHLRLYERRRCRVHRALRSSHRPCHCRHLCLRCQACHHRRRHLHSPCHLDRCNTLWALWAARSVLWGRLHSKVSSNAVSRQQHWPGAALLAPAATLITTRPASGRALATFSGILAQVQQLVEAAMPLSASDAYTSYFCCGRAARF